MKQRAKAVSVVVPVYNTEMYLRECLNSLVEQNLGDELEVLLIDDGSTDGSGQICDEYAVRYPNVFKVYHKQNGGSASARQVGWEESSGQWITVCDSDDFVEKDMYLSMLRAAESTNADMIICDMTYEYADGTSETISTDYGGDEPNAVEVIKRILANSSLSSTCSKLFRRDLFERSAFSWEKDINLGEDTLMILKVLHANPNIKIRKVNRALYHYRRRMGENTYTNMLTEEKWEELKRVHEWKVNNLREKGLERYVAASAVDLIFAYLRVRGGKKKFKNLYPISYKEILMSQSSFLKRTIVLMFKMFDIGIIQPIFNCVYPIFYR